MSALSDDRMQLEKIEAPAAEITQSRRLAEQIAGKKFPPGKGEIDAYLREGLKPPDD